MTKTIETRNGSYGIDFISCTDPISFKVGDIERFLTFDQDILELPVISGLQHGQAHHTRLSGFDVAQQRIVFPDLPEDNPVYRFAKGISAIGNQQDRLYSHLPRSRQHTPILGRLAGPSPSSRIPGRQVEKPNQPEQRHRLSHRSQWNYGPTLATTSTVSDLN